MTLLKLLVATLLFAMGFLASPRELGYLWSRPALLVRSMLAMYVAVPLLAVILALAFTLPRGTELAIVVLAICAGAPLLPRKLIKVGGDPAYVLSLAVTTSLLAIVTVPLSVRILSRVMSVESELGAGMLVRAVAPSAAARFAEPLLGIASAALSVITIVMLIAGWRLVAEVGLPSLLAFAAFALGSLTIGHLFGGPAPGNRTSLAVACTTRHVGLAPPGHGPDLDPVHAMALQIACGPFCKRSDRCELSSALTRSDQCET
jgi:bile acid:Na+ symporter, BASS family